MLDTSVAIHLRDSDPAVTAAVAALEGGILLSLAQPWPTSFFIATISFSIYLAARIVDWSRGRQTRPRAVTSAGSGAAAA